MPSSGYRSRDGCLRGTDGRFIGSCGGRCNKRKMRGSAIRGLKDLGVERLLCLPVTLAG